MNKSKASLFLKVFLLTFSLFVWWLPAVHWAPDIIQYFGINGQEVHGFMGYFQVLLLPIKLSLSGTPLGMQTLENLGINFDYNPPFFGAHYLAYIFSGFLLVYPLSVAYVAWIYVLKIVKRRFRSNK